MKKLQSKKRRKVPVPIASMGDIAFLLIIFFMVCSQISKDNTNLVITPPWSEYVETYEDQIAARVSIDEEGQIWLDGIQVETPKDLEWGVRALVANTSDDIQRQVQFRCDANLTKEQFEPVLEAIAGAGGVLRAVGEDQPQQ